MQIKAGVHAVQLFDTWAGSLAPDDYKEFALPYVEKVIQGIDKRGCPVILFANGVSSILKYMDSSGADVIGLDCRIDIGDAKKRVGSRVSLQGNLDPCVLYAEPSVIKGHVKSILKKYGSSPGHIFNLGHGILPDTPVDNAKALVDIVHEETYKK